MLMAYFNGRAYTNRRGLNMTAANGAIRFETPDTTPTTTSGERVLYVNSSNALIFDDGSSTTALGASGVVSSFALNDAYDDGREITVDAGPVILAGANQDTATLNITADGPSAGPAILIANSGTGNDITGTADWSVTAAGAGDFLSLVGNTVTTGSGSATGVFASSGNFDVTLQTGNATTSDVTIVDGANGDVDITLDGTGAVNINGTTAGNDSLVVAAGDISVTDGSFTLTDADNADTMTITNNTVTTSSATTGGIVEIRSTSLTTGVALNIELTEGQLNGGQYLRCFDVTGNEDVFTLNENGAISMLGNTSGTDTVTVTAGDITLVSGHLEMTVGDITLADGSVNITDADNAASFQVINNTATTAAAISDFSSTSITTGALVRMNANTITHDGEVLELINAGDTTSTGVGLSVTMPDITTGAARGIDVTMVGLTTTGFGIRVTMDAITTGDMLYLDNGGNTLTGDGKFINCNDDNTTLFAVGPLGTVIYRDETEVVTATNTLTTEESGKVCFLNSATEFVSTLPAVAAGLHFTFIVTAAPSAASYTVVTNASANVIQGQATVNGAAVAAVNEDTINFIDGSAAVGDWVELWCDGTNWYVVGQGVAAGAITFTVT